MNAAHWIAREIVGNEVKGFGPLPHEARAEIARWMVDDELMGWPDNETAELTLDDWKWTDETRHEG